MKRLGMHVLILAMVALSATTARAQDSGEVVGIIRQAAERYGVSGDYLVRVARCETGGTFSPTTVGDGGSSFGVFQLHRGGLLESFYRRGGSDPFNVWESSDYAAWAFSQGMARHWSCA